MQTFNEDEISDLAASLTTAWWTDLMRQDERYRKRKAAEEELRKREDARQSLEKRRTRAEAEQIFAQYRRPVDVVVVVKKRQRGTCAA